ncbi:MAG TPA: hypothetical protein VIG66_06835 [Noviherbaspirillum sp.]
MFNPVHCELSAMNFSKISSRIFCFQETEDKKLSLPTTHAARPIDLKQLQEDRKTTFGAGAS